MLNDLALPYHYMPMLALGTSEPVDITVYKTPNCHCAPALVHPPEK